MAGGGAPRVAVVEGARPVIEALLAGRRRIHQIRIPAGEGSPALRALREAARAHDVPVVEAARGDGVSALADPYPELAFEELLVRPAPRHLVALDRVTDVGNLGAIARTAEAAGITGLVLEERRAPPIAAGALRASAGALEHLLVGRTPNLGRALELARKEGLLVLAADPGGTPVNRLDREVLLAESVLLLGSEDRGIRPGLRSLVRVRIGIPMRGRVQSLGVAAAAAYLILRLAEAREGAEKGWGTARLVADLAADSGSGEIA